MYICFISILEPHEKNSLHVADTRYRDRDDLQDGGTEANPTLDSTRNQSRGRRPGEGRARGPRRSGRGRGGAERFQSALIGNQFLQGQRSDPFSQRGRPAHRRGGRRSSSSSRVDFEGYRHGGQVETEETES